jgi:hypothetical protein
MENTNNRVLAKNSQNLAATRCLETWRPPADGMERRGRKLRGNHTIGLALMVSVAYRMMAVKQTALSFRPEFGYIRVRRPCPNLKTAALLARIGCCAGWAPQGQWTAGAGDRATTGRAERKGQNSLCPALPCTRLVGAQLAHRHFPIVQPSSCRVSDFRPFHKRSLLLWVDSPWCPSLCPFPDATRP